MNLLIESPKILNQLKKDLVEINSLKELINLKSKYFGNKGLVKLLFKEIGKLPKNQRKNAGSIIHELQKNASALLKEKELVIEEKESKENLINQAEDLGYLIPKIGHLHPLTTTIREMNSFFSSMGYSIVDGPEIEEDEFCFKRLNVPVNHPARDMQDTLYVEEPNFLLRTQTSSIESRILSQHKPPFKAVSAGKVYRNEKPNKSNHFIFHHYQGFVVLKQASLKDLFGTFTALFKKMYGEKVKVRYRNKYYPEVEPGVGPDMQCFNCHGKGCSLCKGVGWIEMGGAGMIHPKVMEMAGINPKQWKGFAFGLGLDRWVMAKYNITDIRTLMGGNLGYKYYENENTI
jgi:phenylalanyl-tRNA synthetase alpha chain